MIEQSSQLKRVSGRAMCSAVIDLVTFVTCDRVGLFAAGHFEKSLHREKAIFLSRLSYNDYIKLSIVQDVQLCALILDY